MGIIRADYWMARISGKRWAEDEDLPFINYTAVGVWVGAIRTAWWATVSGVGISPALISITVAVVFHGVACLPRTTERPVRKRGDECPTFL